MITMFIDESGSIHPSTKNSNRYFVIGIVIPRDTKRLKKVYKTFIRKNLHTLKQVDTSGKMFNSDGKFIELKGCSMTKPLKQNFINFFCRNNLFETQHIILDNDSLEPRFIQNKARTFNYLLKLFLIHSIKNNYIQDKEIFLQIDNRNVRTESKYSLEDYLNQELVLHKNLYYTRT